MNWFIDALKSKYATFTGRARRKEFWMFMLFYFLILIVLETLDALLHTKGILAFVFILGLIVPSIAVYVRRLHDTDRSGWWILLGLIPFIGSIILLIFLVLEGTPGENKYGPNPKLA